MEWFPLALLSALSLATADALTKRYLADYSGRELVVIRFGMPALLLLPLAIANPLPAVPPPFWGWIALLIPLELLAMWLYMVAIRDSPLHLTLPYLAFTPVFVLFSGFLLLGERVTWRGLAGILLVMGGAYLLNSGRAGDGLWAPLRAILRERGSRLMVVVAAIYGVTSVVGKAALAYVSPLVFGPFYFAVLGIASVAFVGLSGGRRNLMVLGRRPLVHLLVGALVAGMVMTHFLAIAKVEVAYMIAVKRTSLLFGILYGALLFGERRLAHHLFAGALMVAGVALIAS